jgi:hypothetical protein
MEHSSIYKNSRTSEKGVDLKFRMASGSRTARDISCRKMPHETSSRLLCIPSKFFGTQKTITRPTVQVQRHDPNLAATAAPPIPEAKPDRAAKPTSPLLRSKRKPQKQKKRKMIFIDKNRRREKSSSKRGILQRDRISYGI